jgi:hypothetical protein
MVKSLEQFSRLCEMDSSSITYTPRPDATPEAELSALASAYRFVLDCRAKKEAAPESRPDDARKDQDAGTYPHCT